MIHKGLAMPYLDVPSGGSKGGTCCAFHRATAGSRCSKKKSSNDKTFNAEV